jgi:hypothetical protein
MNNLTLDEVFALIEKLGGVDAVRKFLSQGYVVSLDEKKITQPLCGVVNYEMCLESAAAQGGYAKKSRLLDRTEWGFPIHRKGVYDVEFYLHHFNREIRRKDAIELICSENAHATNPWCIAEVEDLLVFGELFPHFQLEYPIAALGSITHDGKFIYLNKQRVKGTKQRRIDSLWEKYFLHKRYRILLVRRKIRPV